MLRYIYKVGGEDRNSTNTPVMENMYIYNTSENMYGNRHFSERQERPGTDGGGNFRKNKPTRLFLSRFHRYRRDGQADGFPSQF